MIGRIFLSLALFGVFMDAQAATKQVLVIASSKPFDEVKGLKLPSSESLLRSVKSYLSRDLKVRGIVKLTVVDPYETKTLDVAYGGGGSLRSSKFYCHSLAQWYFWPEGRKERLANLKGEGKVKWDHVVLVGDPYIMANMPGYYAEGVWHLSEAIKEGGAQPVIFVPSLSGDAKVRSQIQEVAYRVGGAADIPVLPKKKSKSLEAKLKKVYMGPTPFSMKSEKARSLRYHHTGTSSERGIEKALGRVFTRSKISGKRSNPKDGFIHFNYGRANSNFEKNKQYQVNPKLFGRSYGFPMQDHSGTAEVTMLYGLDKRFFDGKWYEDGTDLGISWDMVRQSEVEKDIRCLPIRLLWAKFNELAPEEKPCRDRWHMSHYLDDATATFLYTLESGRCSIGPKPDQKDEKAHLSWLAQRVGYETAWRMSSLNERVSGFTVRPDSTAENLAIDRSTELTVSFQYPPKGEVSVQIKSPEGSTISSDKLVFTPDNYLEPQKVTFSPGEKEAKEVVEVVFSTTSEDQVFDDLEDVWTYRLLTKK